MNKNQHGLIKKFVHQLKKDLDSIKSHQFSVIFTGLTGSGKGTLINFLKKNHKLFAKMSDTGDMIIELRTPVYESLQQITISCKMASDTSIPHQTLYKGQVYRDLPGFMDNRVDQNYIPQDIINSFFINQVYEKTQNIKIVFTASKNSLNDKTTEFVNSLTNFAQQFQNISKIIDSLFLVVTKVPSHLENKHIKATLKRIIQDLNSQISLKTKMILQTWVTNQNLIELFKVPQMEGQLNFNHANVIYEKLKKISYSKSPKINNIICQQSQSKMLELQQRWNESISNICHELVKANYEEYLKKIQKIKILNTAKSNLNYLRHKLDQLMGAQNPEEFKTRLKQVPELYKSGTESKSKELMKQFEDYYDFLHFFTKIHPKIYNIHKWKQHLYKIHHSITQIVSEPWQQIHGSYIYIKGFVIQSAIIQKKINFLKSNYPCQNTKVIIFAYFFMMNEDIHYPGGSLMIFTEYFIVQSKNVKIRLNGENAKDYSVLTANDNTDGCPGRPGQNGGNLFIKVNQRSDNLQHISVDIRGGKGGKGQNGGQIKLQKINKVYINYLMHDKDLPTKEKQYLVYRQDYKFSQRNIFSKLGEVFRILATYNGQVVEFYSTEVQIEDKLNNFVYTLGGAGGKPGNCGNFHNLTGSTIVSVCEPQQSENGEAHVQVYEGLYVKEMIFPNFRDEGKEYNLKKMIQDKNLEMEFKRVEEEMRQKVQKQKMKKSKKLIQNQDSPEGKRQIENSFFTNEEYQAMAQELKKQIQEEEELTTPPLYLRKYKQQAEYLQEQIIREQENEEEEKSRIIDKKPIKKQTQNQILETKKTNLGKINTSLNGGVIKIDGRLKIVRKPSIQNYLSRINHIKNRFDPDSSIKSYMKTSSKNSGLSPPQKYLSSKLLMPRKKFDSEHLKQKQKLLIDSQLITQLKIKAPQWGKQVGKELATDIGTGTVQKVAQKIIDKIWEKALRSGLTMEKEVFKQFAETAIKAEADKKLLAELGLLTTGNLKKQIAKAVTTKSEQLIFTHFGKEVLRDTAQVMQRQAVKHLGEDLFRRIGTQGASQAEIQIAAKSISSGTVYVEGMMEGVFKSMLFQVFLSVLMASGITDGWIIKPHFKSKKINLKIYNHNQIQDPEPQQDFTTQQIRKTQAEYKFFQSSFKQFQNVFSNKI